MLPACKIHSIMPKLTAKDRRLRLRKTLSGSKCINPISVFDPVSARIARYLDFEVAMLAGSVTSAVVLGAPDIVVLTLSEFVEQARRITRAADLSLIVDADHGYGNALNVMRTVEELEHADISALTIEDTFLPKPFQQTANQKLLGLEAMVSTLRAALAARSDPSLVIIGRTAALGFEGIEETAKRVKAYSETGVDAIFLTNITKWEELNTIRNFTDLPIMLGSTPENMDNLEKLAEMGVRLALAGHTPFQASVKVIHEIMLHLKQGGSSRELQDKIATSDLMGIATGEQHYTSLQKDFLE